MSQMDRERENTENERESQNIGTLGIEIQNERHGEKELYISLHNY